MAIFLYVQPEDSIHVLIDPSSRESPVKISGSNAPGQTLYNHLIRAKRLADNDPAYHQYSDSLDAAALGDTIKVLYNEEIYHYEELLKNRQIDSMFFRAVQNDLTYYYASFLSHIIQSAYSATQFPPGYPGYRQYFPEGYDEMWAHLLDSIHPNSAEAISSIWFPDYTAHDYMWYNGFFLLQRAGEFDNHQMNKNLWKYMFDHYKSSFSGKNLEFSLATYLWTSTYHRYDIEFLDLHEEFAQMFPSSRYMDYLTPHMDRIRLFHELAEAPEVRDTTYRPVYDRQPVPIDEIGHPLDKVHFLDPTDSKNTLKEAVASFRGSVVYVDIWATWCGPCLEEFQYEDELKRFLKNHGVEMLYISLDKDSYHDKWMDFIKVYHLTGSHIRANENLRNDIRRVTGVNAIPLYLIVDENGIVVEKMACRPGMKEQLYDQILKYCDK